MLVPNKVIQVVMGRQKLRRQRGGAPNFLKQQDGIYKVPQEEEKAANKLCMAWWRSQVQQGGTHSRE